jgi:aminoacrylate hydrolase
MVALLRHLEPGEVHIVGASTGGAIAQYIALNHPELVRSLTLSSTFARFDSFAEREFSVRRKIAAEWSRSDMFSAYALFLFSPRYTREHPDRVASWIDRAASNPEQPDDREIALKRIDMIMAHDTFSRLREIKQPSLVLCGDHNLCTPLPLSEELAQGIAGAQFELFTDAGELIELEQDHRYFEVVSRFLDAH